MSNQQQSHRQHQHYQQHPANDHRAYQERQRPGNPLEQRREFLWRERVKLELQVQALLALLQGLEQEYRMLQHRKASMEQEKPKLATQIVLSGLAGTRSLSAERLYQYRRECLMQEEERLGQAMIRYQHELAGLHGQIEVILLELSFLG
jgi:predicted RecB family nuclease